MCFYITATLPKTVEIDNLTEIFESYDMAFIPLQNKSVQSQIKPGDSYFRVTKEYCDCDTILGSFNNLQEYQKLLNSQKVRTLRKKNWTDDQINIWIKEKLKQKNPAIVKKLSKSERDKKIKRWINLFYGLLDNKKVPRVGLLKHWYQKGLEDEDLTLSRIKEVRLKNVTPEFLYNLEEDVLYEIRS